MPPKKRRPATLTVFGIYSRIISKAQGVAVDVVNQHVDLLPLNGSLMVVGLDPAMGEGITDPERWKEWDTRASSELGQKVVTTLDADNGLATIDLPAA